MILSKTLKEVTLKQEWENLRVKLPTMSREELKTASDRMDELASLIQEKKKEVDYLLSRFPR